jgi:hypothetical protein
MNDSLACYEFTHVIARGDYAVAKIGRNKLLGIGKVLSEYVYEPTRPEYHHIRRVRWLRAANIELPHNAWVPTKTLTDASDYKAFVDFVIDNLLSETVESAPSTEELPTYSFDEAFKGPGV